AQEIARLVAVQVRPRIVLLEAIDVLTRQKIEIPTYNLLANTIVAAMDRRQQALSDIIDSSLTQSQREKLDALLAKAPVEGEEDGWRYRLTLLKKPFQSTKPAKIKANLLDQQSLQALYLDLRTFVVYQTYKLNDTLIDILLNTVQATLNTVDKELKEAYFEDREQRHQSFSSLVERLRQNVRETLSAIKRIVADERLTDSQKVALIDSELNPTDAKPGQLELQFDAFEQSAAKLHADPDRLALLEARSLKLQHRVAEIVRQVEFAPNCSKPALLEAVAQYRRPGQTFARRVPRRRRARLPHRSGREISHLALQDIAVRRGCRGHQVRCIEPAPFGEVPFAGRLSDPESGLGREEGGISGTRAAGKYGQLPRDAQFHRPASR